MSATNVRPSVIITMDDGKITQIAAKILRISPEDLTVTELSGDASNRRFFRLSVATRRKNKNVILVSYPPGESEAVDHHMRMSDCLRQVGIQTPRIFLRSEDGERILMEDCGDKILQRAIAGGSRRRILDLYSRALDLLILMQEKLRPDRQPACPAWKTVFDEEKFFAELEFFLKHAIGGYYRRRISGRDRTGFEDYFLRICRETLSQPLVFCHRDFHSRNLLLHRGKLRMVDFQDARLGPYTYDAVSLLEDPYADLPPVIRRELRNYFFSRRPEFMDGIFRRRYERDFAIMTVQRVLKAAGTFGFMFAENNKKGYVKYLPAAFRSVKAALEGLPELAELSILLEKYCKF